MSATVELGMLEALVLALLRVSAFLVVAPPFSAGAIPARVKVILAMGLAIAVLPRIAPDYQPADSGRFVLGLGLEVVTGVALGFLVSVVFAAVQSAGNLIDLFGGFQLAQAFDPQMMLNGAQFARLFQMTALAIMFASGAYQIVIGGLVRSFTAVPLGGAIDFADAAQGMVGSLSEMVVSALQIAGPLIVVLFLADAGLGLLSRVAPALNVFAMSFPVKILLTLLLAGTVFVLLPSIVEALTGDAIERIGQVHG